jgi:hypothetical protein
VGSRVESLSKYDGAKLRNRKTPHIQMRSRTGGWKYEVDSVILTIREFNWLSKW